MDRSKFYNAIRTRINLTTSNVAGFEKILTFGGKRGTLLGFFAYILATAFWETAQTMQPVKEAYWLSETWRKTNLRYYPWYGRGYVQTTWKENYTKIAVAMGLPENTFIDNPDLLTLPEYAIPALFVGMEQGIYTGKDLDDFIDNIDENDAEDLREYKAARTIVNGNDKAAEIAKLALVFEAGLKAAGYDIDRDIPGPVIIKVPTKEPIPLDKPGVIVLEQEPQSWWQWFKGFFV